MLLMYIRKIRVHMQLASGFADTYINWYSIKVYFDKIMLFIIQVGKLTVEH